MNEIIINPLNKDMLYHSLIDEALEQRYNLRISGANLDKWEYSLLQKDYDILAENISQYALDMKNKLTLFNARLYGIKVKIRSD